MNSTTLYGNLVADPELRYTAKGVPVANFRVASNRSRKADSKADFVTCTAWGHMAESVALLAKGTFVKVAGSIRTEAYVAKDGSNRTATKLVARSAAAYSKPAEVAA